MLTASGGTTYGSASMHSTLLFERRFWVHVVERRGLAFDARFMPPAERQSRSAVVYLLLDGEFVVQAPSAARFEAPASFVLDENEYEGFGRKRSLLFRAVGEPFVAIDLRLDQKELLFGHAPAPRRFDLGSEGWRAAREVSSKRDATSVTAAARTLMRELEGHGVIRPGIAASISDGDDRFARLWAATAPAISRYHALPTLQELAVASDLSLRHLAREMRAFIESFRVMGSNWREITRRSRVKLAVLGLSSKDASIGEVARIAGYGSTDAMARAFRDAGLPAPNAVQLAMRAPTR
jgi:AraC-like DNA-binding protein